MSSRTGLTKRKNSKVGKNPAEANDLSIPVKVTKDEELREQQAPIHPKIDTNRQLRAVESDVWKLLLAANTPPRYFQRGGELVETRGEVGSQTISPVGRNALIYDLVHLADWVHLSGEDRSEPTVPSVHLLNCLLHQPHPELPELDHYSDIPVLTAEGGILAEPGYHPTCRTFVATASELESLHVPEMVASDSVAAAKALILDDLMGDFPFETPADLANAVAMLLLPFVRLYLSDASTPLHVVSAPTAGTGKGLLCSSVALVVTGTPMAAMAANRGEDEMRKRITSLLARDARFVVIDNLPEKTRLDSGALASVLTSTRWTDRRLGGNAMPVYKNSAVWVLNGNNPRLSSELARRSVQIRLNAHIERPWERNGFHHPDLLRWTSDNRRELVEACLVLLQNWLQQGAPHWSGSPIGSFERWCAVMGGILETAGIEGFLDNRNTLFDVSDLELNEWRTLVSLWAEKHQAELVKTTDLLALAEEADVLGEVIGGGSEKSQSSRLGRALQQRVDSVIGEHVIRRSHANRNSGRYRLEAVSRPIQR